MMRILLVSLVGAVAAPLAINGFMLFAARGKVFKGVSEVPEKPVAIILGALVVQDYQPSSILADRLEAGLRLYQAKKVKKLLVTGDHGTKGYDEVNTMRHWLMQRGVPSEDIFMDHAGFRTFDSMVRARKVFEVTDAVVCTQSFHQARSLFLAQQSGINAVGLSSDFHVYRTAKKNTIREFGARIFAVLDVLFGKEPKYLGEKIPITGSGEATHDHRTKSQF